jgi:hypothetical protein
MPAKKKSRSQKPLPKSAKQVTLSKKKYYCYSKRVNMKKGAKTRGFCRSASSVMARKGRKGKKK